MSEQRPSDQDDHGRSRLAEAWDIARYAPIGLLVEGPFLLPKLAQMGKAHVHNAQVLGRLAVRQGEAELRRRLSERDSQVAETLRLLGLLPVASETEPASAVPPTQGLSPNGDAAEAPVEQPQARSTDGRSSAGEVPAKPMDPPRPDAGDLAIPAYDSLAAPQVVNRLSGLDPDQLEAVRRYEVAHRGRKTILNKVAQLQA